MRLLFLFGSLLVAVTTVAQTQKASDVADFVSVDTSVFVLNHVRVIDGTGAPAKEDQAVLIAHDKIQSIGPAASAQIPEGAQRVERSGYTVIPGLVGMHNHLYYTPIPTPCKSSAERLANLDYLLPRFPILRRDSIWRLPSFNQQGRQNLGNRLQS